MLVELLALGLAFGLGLAVQSARQQGRHDEDFGRLLLQRRVLLDAAGDLLCSLPKQSAHWLNVLHVHNKLLLDHGIQPVPAASAEELH